MNIKEYFKNKGISLEEAKNILIEGLKQDVCITHNGVFHADDVFSYVILSMYRKKVLNIENCLEVIRTRNIPDDFKGVVFDVNGGYFDHHGPKDSASYRADGVQHASVGIIWYLLGMDLITACSDKLSEVNAINVFEDIDSSLIRGIDGMDNGEFGYPEVNFVNLFNPSCYEDSSEIDEKFQEAVVFAKTYLDRLIIKTIDSELGSMEVEDALLQTGEWCFLERYLPWSKTLIPSDKKIVAWYDKEADDYKAQVIPIDFDTFDAKISFPENWAGLRNEELSKVSGIDGMIFCHSARFFLVVKTFEGLKKALEITLS